MPRIANTVDDLLEMLARGSAESDDPGINLLDHALQTASMLEREAPSDDELQAAGLLHDVGACLAPGRPRTHAGTGRTFVEELLGPRVAWLVSNHDVAKRYLVTTDPGYWERLSDHSRATFELQGGPLTVRERHRLRDAPGFPDLMLLRTADDFARATGRAERDLGTWRDVLEAVAARCHAGAARDRHPTAD
jgi:predicted HD phosphohydrolase